MTFDQLEDWIADKLPILIQDPHSADSLIIATIEAEKADNFGKEIHEIVKESLRSLLREEITKTQFQVFSTAAGSSLTDFEDDYTMYSYTNDQVSQVKSLA